MFGTCPIAPPGGWGAQKPMCGVQIDRARPLSRWLARLPFNEGSGSRVNDAARIVQPAPLWSRDLEAYPRRPGPGF